MHAILAPQFPESAFLDTSWVASRSVPAKVAYMHAMAFSARCMYYFIWLLADAACCAGGLGWSGFEAVDGGGEKSGSKEASAKKAGKAKQQRGIAKWERTCNVHPVAVEAAGSAAEFPLCWNVRTGAWLRHYCYERLLQRPARLPPFAALMLTQCCSGVWHGTRAGYALFFVGSGLMLHASKVIFRYQRAIPPSFRLTRRCAALAHWALAAFHLSYLAAAFISVTLQAGLAAFASVGWAGHISMTVCQKAARGLETVAFVRT